MDSTPRPDRCPPRRAPRGGPSRRSGRPGRAAFLALLCAIALPLVAGCSYVNHENRYVAKWLDASVRPTSTGARVALAPVALPAGLLGYGADALVIHPLVQLGDTTRITYDHVWDDIDVRDFLDVALLPIRAAYTPVVFGIVYVWRVVFPLDRYRWEDAPDAASQSTPTVTAFVSEADAVEEVSR